MENRLTNTNYADPELETLVNLEGNSECFDCGSSPAGFASINNSIFLCVNCAGEHRSYGVHVSYIRSLFLDRWSSIQIKYMKAGGNQKLNQLLDAYEIDKNIIDKNAIYVSKLLEFHRNSIKSIVNNGISPVPPSAIEAMTTVTQVIPQDATTLTYSQIPISEEPKSAGFFSNVASAFKGAYGRTKEVATNIRDKVIDMDIGTTIKNTGMKTAEISKTTGTKIKETGTYTVQKLKDAKDVIVGKGSELATKVAVSETAQNFKQKAENGYIYVKEHIFGKEKNEDQIEEQQNDQLPADNVDQSSAPTK